MSRRITLAAFAAISIIAVSLGACQTASENPKTSSKSPPDEGTEGAVTERWGFIDHEGKFVIPLKYDSADTFSCGLARVTKNAQYLSDTYYFINKNGRVRFQVDDACGERFSENLLNFRRKGKWGYKDTTGKTVIEPRFADAAPFSEGLGAVSNGERWGYTDREGNMAIDFRFSKARPFHEGIAVVKAPESTGAAIDKKGKFTFKGYSYAGDMGDGLAVVKNGKCGYVDRNGRVIIPLKFDKAETFSQGAGFVMVGKNWGIIDTKGNWVAKPTFYRIFPYTEGYAGILYHNGMEGFMDRDGNIAIPAKYHDAGGFKEGLAPVSINDRWGYINKEGEIVIKMNLEFGAPFSEGLAAVSR